MEELEQLQEHLFGLMGVAEEQQKAITAALEGLAGEREGLKKAVREAAAEAMRAALAGVAEEAGGALEKAQGPLVEQLSEATWAARTVTSGLNGVVRWFSWRVLVFGLFLLVVFSGVVFGAGWLMLRSQESRAEELARYSAALAAKIEQQRAFLAEWEEMGGPPSLQPCGPRQARRCVRVDKEAGVFGEKKDLYVPLAH